MAKWMKKLLGLAAIGSAAAGLVYYFKISKKDVDEDFNDEDSYEDDLYNDELKKSDIIIDADEEMEGE